MNIHPKYTLLILCVILASAMLPACADELSSVTEVTKLRVLGVAVTPPEIQPENTYPITVEVLWHDPEANTRESQFAWIFCQGDVPAATGFEYCTLLNETQMPPTVVSAEDNGDTFVVPPLPQEVFALIPEGESATFTAIILLCAGGTLPGPNGYLNSTTADIDSLCKGGEAVSIYKDIRVANGHFNNDETNIAPEINIITLNNRALTASNPNTDIVEINEIPCLEGDCNRDLTVDVSFTEDSAQDYTVIRFDELVTETERPYISWFATGGSFDMPFTLTAEGGFLESIHWNPELPGDYTLWAVANDGRGGISWNSYFLHVE